jgi:hypothetical protein
MTPGKAAPKAHPASALAGISPPRKISDATTEAAANNAMAAGYRSGTVRPGQMTQPGFSAGAQQQMRSAQQQAAGVGQGAQQAAGIRAEDQAFNAEQQAGYDQLVQSRLNSNYDTMTGLNNANWQKRFAQQSNRLGMQQARQQAWQNIRLALLSQME